MTLYLYRAGTNVPLLAMEDVASYTADRALAADGTLYGPFGEECELSSLPDCTETLRADWRRMHPSQEARMEELEALVAELLFGGSAPDGGEGV